MRIRLIEAPDGAVGVVVDVIGGKGRIKKLLELGIVPGVRITIIKNPPYGPIIVKARGYNLAIGRGLAESIYIEI
jgi:ferrous iron transport protein A